MIALNFFKPLLDYVRPPINSEDVIILYGVKVYKDSRPDALDYIVVKYPNFWKETERVIDIFKEY